LNEKSSNFHVKLLQILGLLSEGSAISPYSAMKGRGISMSYTKSESLLDDLSKKPTFVKIRRRIEEVVDYMFEIWM
jgi:hypothetical protein